MTKASRKICLLGAKQPDTRWWAWKKSKPSRDRFIRRSSKRPNSTAQRTTTERTAEAGGMTKQTSGFCILEEGRVYGSHCRMCAQLQRRPESGHDTGADRCRSLRHGGPVVGSHHGL